MEIWVLKWFVPGFSLFEVSDVIIHSFGSFVWSKEFDSLSNHSLLRFLEVPWLNFIWDFLVFPWLQVSIPDTINLIINLFHLFITDVFIWEQGRELVDGFLLVKFGWAFSKSSNLCWIKSNSLFKIHSYGSLVVKDNTKNFIEIILSNLTFEVILNHRN